MKIIDINGKEREAKSIKIIDHEVPVVGPNAKEGEMMTVKYVQVLIKPHFESRTPWLEWYLLDKFKKLNPKIKVK